MKSQDKRPTVCISIPPGVAKSPFAHLLARALPVPKPMVKSASAITTRPIQSRQEILQVLYDATFITDLEGRIQELNNRAIDFFKYDPGELQNQKIIELISGAEESLVQNVRENLLNHRFTYIEAYCVRKTGVTFPAEIVVNIMYRNDVERLCFFVRDTSRRKLAEDELRSRNEQLVEMNQKLQENHAQLIQSEKMAAIGQIAAGVAHEINNPVGFVRSNLNTLSEYVELFQSLFLLHQELSQAVKEGNLELARQKSGAIQEFEQKENLLYVLRDIRNLISESIEGVERTKEIVQNLKTFARVDESERKEANLNDGIEATLKILTNELKYKCEVRKRLGNIPLLYCYPGQLNQVFMNLILNASQAIKKQGVISIETMVEGEQVVIRISDTGEGIDPKNINRLFTPFYTTKPAGEGTGLGLSISYSIINKHRGNIEVESELGKGTSFTIRLPIKTSESGT